MRPKFSTNSFNWDSKAKIARYSGKKDHIWAFFLVPGNESDLSQDYAPNEIYIESDSDPNVYTIWKLAGTKYHYITRGVMFAYKFNSMHASKLETTDISEWVVIFEFTLKD